VDLFLFLKHWKIRPASVCELQGAPFGWPFYSGLVADLSLSALGH
jgi:hypothetical protein